MFETKANAHSLRPERVDGKTLVHFVRDIYRRDKRLDEALREKPPTA